MIQIMLSVDEVATVQAARLTLNKNIGRRPYKEVVDLEM